jgi:MULE transposase domain
LDHRGIIGYSDSKEILVRQGLKISAKEYYNLHRKEGNLPLTKSEEHELLMGILERNGYHPRCRCEYILENGVRKSRVVRDIFFMSDEQIRLTRRFVSGFMYETDATSNTNTLRLLLSVIVGVDNTSLTFPLAFMFMTSESAKAFKFTSDQLTDLVFYDCP